MKKNPVILRPPQTYKAKRQSTVGQRGQQANKYKFIRPTVTAALIPLLEIHGLASYTGEALEVVKVVVLVVW